jgi:hypothetical protein
MSIFRTLVVVISVTVGCTTSDTGPEPEPVDAGVEPDCFFGDPNEEPVAELVHRIGIGADLLLEGGDVDMILPPQGGKVILVGVRAKNINLCAVGVSAAVRDTCDGGLLSREGREIALVAADDGWAYPVNPDLLDNYANVAMCPNRASSRDIDGYPYQIEVRLTDQLTRKNVLVTMSIVPRCNEANVLQECECTCDNEYELGRDCTIRYDDSNDVPPGECPVVEDGQ